MWKEITVLWITLLAFARIDHVMTGEVNKDCPENSLPMIYCVYSFRVRMFFCEQIKEINEDPLTYHGGLKIG